MLGRAPALQTGRGTIRMSPMLNRGADGETRTPTYTGSRPAAFTAFATSANSGPLARSPRTILGSSHCARHRQKPPLPIQHRLKAAPRPARTQIVPTELFDQLLVAVHDALPALHARLRREAISTLAGPLKRTSLESEDCVWWSPPCHENADRFRRPRTTSGTGTLGAN